MNLTEKKTIRTGEIYSFLWNRTSRDTIPSRWHFTTMQEVIGEPIVRGAIGIEIGSGCGYDTWLMAKGNPATKIISIDISDGIYNTKKLVEGLGNVFLMKSSAISIALKNSSVDFAYSFGVLHHTPDPAKGFSEIRRILKKNSPVFLYLYEDHSGNPIKWLAIKATSAVRIMTTRLPRKALYILAWFASPLVFFSFTLPSRILKRFNITRHIAEKMPFSFGTSPFSLQPDLYDRFGAPIERRFSREGLHRLFMEYGFSDVRISKLRDIAGWVAWGYKA